MNAYHHSGDGSVKPFGAIFHQCGDGNRFTIAVKWSQMKHPNRIRELRERRDLSLQALADMVGSSAQQMHRLERGERRLSDHWMERLAPVLGVKAWELMTDAPTADADVDELMRIYTSLDDERRARLKADALDLLAAQKARGRDEEDDSDQPG